MGKNSENFFARPYLTPVIELYNVLNVFFWFTLT